MLLGKLTNSRRYFCPVCSASFRAPEQKFTPPNVPWYMPDTLAARCPDCKASLKSKYRTIQYALSLVVFAELQVWNFLDPKDLEYYRDYFRIIAVLLATCFLIVMHVEYADQNTYVEDIKHSRNN